MKGFNKKIVEFMIGARLLYVTVCLCISMSVAWFPNAVQAAVQRGLIPGIDENTPYCFFYGKWDDAIIQEVIQQGFKLVILHPGGNGVLNPGTNEVLITPEQVARLKQEGIITIGYISIGEDYVGNREGDGTGPVYYDEENCQLVYQNQGVASWYLDDGEPHDGIPDKNPNFDSYFVNAGDPNWQEFIETATIEHDGFAGTEYILNILGCDGLFLDVIETATPWGKYDYTWRGMFDLIDTLSNLYPDKYMVGNRPLFACDTQWYPLTCCGDHPESCSQFCFCDFSSAAEARDRFRQNLNAMVWESYSLDREYTDFENTRGNVLTCADNTDSRGFSVMVLDYYNLIHGLYTCMDEQIEEVNALGWLDYIAPGPLYQIGYWVINYCRNLSTPLIDGYFNDWKPWNAGWLRLDPDEAEVSKVSADIINIQLSHDVSYLYAKIGCKGTIPETFDSNFYQIYLDTDADTVGYQGSSADWAAAYNFLWENGKLYRYTGSGSDWSWLEVNSTTCYRIGFIDESSMEIAIPLAVLDVDLLQEQTTRLLFAVNAFDVGQNDRAPQDPTQDAYVYEYKPLINIDGDFSDWENLPQCMFASYTDRQECICICPADILHVNVCSDATNMYFDMRFVCNLPNPLWGGNFYQIFIDADQNSSTGYNLGSWAIGAEYLWENGKLFEHMGGGWNWTSVLDPTEYAVGVAAGSRMEFAIPRSLIWTPACQRYLSKDKPLRFIARVTNGVSSLDMTPNVPTSDFHQWPVPEEIIMGLPAGWSMISLPVVPESLVLSDIFPEAVVVYGFDGNAGYVRVQANEELEVGKGYWILLNEAQTYALTGECIQEYPLSVEDGWYMIGGCTHPAQVVPHGCDIGVIYGFNQEVGYQRVTGHLEPGKGYWILLDNAIPEATISVETVD